ncbi:MAG: hypothetical protein LQ346_001307 [Caloplaca aetnensis]|nr:MAG: hypothetical protein LQ346_001307 [Caloplaca aetnensis]
MAKPSIAPVRRRLSNQWESADASQYPNPTTSRNTDWDFIRQSYEYERQLVDQIHQLNHQVAVKTAALREAESSANKDQIALNVVSTRLADISRSHNELQVELARVQNRGHEEAEELRQLQLFSHRRRLHATELEKDLDCLRKAHARMGELISYRRLQDGAYSPFVDVSLLLLELQTKSARMEALEKEKERISRALSEEKDRSASSLRQHVRDLQQLAPSGPIHDSSPRTNQGSTGGRKRDRGRTRSAEPNFPEVKRMKIVNVLSRDA